METIQPKSGLSKKETSIVKDFKVDSMELTMDYNKTKFTPKRLLNFLFKDDSGNTSFCSLTKEDLFRLLIKTHYQ